MSVSLRSHKGFTLVEVLIVVAMFGVIMGAVYTLYVSNSTNSIHAG